MNATAQAIVSSCIHWVFFAWVLALVINQAQAAPSNTTSTAPQWPKQLPNLRISAPLLPSYAKHSSTVLSSEDLRLFGQTTVSTVLATAFGIHLDRTALPGGVTSLYLRGADPNYTAVFIDGVKVNDATNTRGGSFDFSTLQTQAIERIEILRGPLSALYGSDALAGVVLITTKQGVGAPSVGGTISGGSWGMHQEGILTHGVNPSYDFALGGQYYNSGTPNATTARFEENLEPETINQQGTANVGFLLPTGGELRLSTRFNETQQQRFPDDSGGSLYALLPALEQEDLWSKLLSARLTKELSPSSTYQLQIGWLRNNTSTDSPGVLAGTRDPFGIPPNTSSTTFERFNTRLAYTFGALDDALLVLGGEAQFETSDIFSEISFPDLEGTTLTDYFSLSRNIWSFFAQGNFNLFSQTSLVLSARSDLLEGGVSQFSPQAGVSYEFQPSGFQLYANVGQGFKLPSMYALGNTIVGNRELLAEKSTGIEMGGRHRLLDDTLQVELQGFVARYQNGIDLEEGPPLRLVNRSQIHTHGAELAFFYLPNKRFSFRPQLSYLVTDIEDSDEPLRNRPTWRSSMLFEYAPTSWFRFTSRMLYVGSNYDSSIPTGQQKLVDYSRLDVASHIMLDPDWELTLSIDNVTDSEYEEVIGLPAPGIGARVELSLQDLWL